ncbi:MAG TPA: LysM peptidoglycan-binding domain-containing protein [Nitrospirae bacterium]|nr:LysM peptidoglycan-binding domain-containing protein [Nitrospirota bacterium]
MVIAGSIFILNPVFGLNLQYKDYEVKKGDTLWDISSAELKDPFLWPNIWKENPGIKNPDLIYPSRHIRIPVYPAQKQVRLSPPPATEISAPKETARKVETPETKKKPTPKKGYLINKNLAIMSGYISPVITSVGTIKGTPTGRTMLGKGDYAYIDVSGDTTVGRKFYTFRYTSDIKHPDGKNLGYLIEITGIAKIIGNETGNTKIVITRAFRAINVNDYLQDYFEIEPPLKVAKPRMPDIHGVVVTARDLREINAQNDIVYIDKGSADGVLAGDEFNIIAGKYPHIPIGKIIIILTKNKTSTALITKSIHIIKRGDTF